MSTFTAYLDDQDLIRIQKGEETALIEFDSAGKSLSVYGVSVNNEFDVPRWDMTIMDNWALIINN